MRLAPRATTNPHTTTPRRRAARWPACNMLLAPLAAATSRAAPGTVHERCYTTLAFRGNSTAARRSPVQDGMLQLWIRRLRSFTALPIVIMHANMPSPKRLMNATAYRLQLHRVSLLIVEPPGTLPWYREQYTKLHAWSLPCRQVACAFAAFEPACEDCVAHTAGARAVQTSTTTASRCATWTRSSTSAETRPFAQWPIR